MRFRSILSQWATAIFLIGLASSHHAASYGCFAQEPTPLVPVAAMEGEDHEMLKSLFEQWDKQAKSLKVSGSVVDAAGKAVANAQLSILVDQAVRLQGQADSEGKFRFNLPMTSFPQVYAESEGAMLAGLNEHSLVDRDGNLTLKVIAYPTVEAKVTVRNAKGAIVAKANCGAFFDGFLIARAQSDVEGKVSFRVPELIPPASEDRRNRLPGFYAFANEVGVGIASASMVDGEVSLPEEISLVVAKPLTVKVVDRDQKTMPGLPVVVLSYPAMAMATRMTMPGGGFGGSTGYSSVYVPFSSDPRSYAKSNEMGAATLSWFAAPNPPELPGRAGFGGRAARPVAVGAMHPEWDHGMGSFNPDSEISEATCMLYSPTTIRGRVKLPSGEPAAGIVLESQSGGLNPFSKRSVTTNAKGEFEFVGRLSDSDLLVKDGKWVADRINIATLTQKSATNEVDLTLREGKRVRIRLTAGPEYLPLPNHRIYLVGRGMIALFETDKEGRVNLTLDRGLYTVNISTTEQTQFALSSEHQLLVKDQAELEVPIHLDIAQPRLIKVTVLKPDGVTPAAKANVEILNPYSDDIRSARDRQLMALRGDSGFGGGGFAGGIGGGGGGRGGPPGGMGGVGGPSGFSGGSAGTPQRQGSVTVATDDAGKAELKAPLAAPASLVITGAEDEKAILKVDVLEDSATITLAKTVAIKGKILDETTGAPVADKEVYIQLDFSRTSSDETRSSRTATGRGGVSRFRLTAFTDKDGNFEFKGLVADSAYQMEMVDGRGGLPPGFPAGGFGGGGFGGVRTSYSPLSMKAFRTEKAGVKDLGEIKTKSVSTPAPEGRPRIPNDPNRIQ